MPDVFDTLEAPAKADVFDEISALAPPDIFDTLEAPAIDPNSPEVVSRLKAQQQAGDVGRQNQSMAESREGLVRGMADITDRVHASATQPGGLLNAGEWTEAAKNFLPSRILNRIAGNPPDQPFIPKDLEDQISYAFKVSVGDVAGMVPGATPGFRKAVEGGAQSAADTGLSFVNPDIAFGGELVKGGGMTAAAVKAAFVTQMASAAPEAFQKTVHALKYGDETEIGKSLSDLAITTGLPLAIVGESMGKPKQPMDYHGSQIPMPKGARPPDAPPAAVKAVKVGRKQKRSKKQATAAPPAAVKAVKEGVDAGLPLSAEAASKRKEVAPVISETVPTGVNKSAATIVEPTNPLQAPAGEVNPVEPVLHEFSDKEDAAQQAVLSSLQPANETDVKTVSDWAKKNTKWPKDFLMFRGKEGTPSEGMEAALTPISKPGQPYQVTFFARDPRGNLTPFGDVPVSTLEEGIRNAHQRNFEHVESKEAPVQAEPGTVAKPSGVAGATPDSVPVGVKASDAPPQRLKLKGSPQVFTLVERLPQTATEKEMGEQPVRVKNERTGKVETMMESDFTPVSSTAKLKPKSDSKSDLDSKLRALGMDPSVFKSNAEKKMAIARAKAKATPMPSPTPDSPSEQEPKTKSAPGPATEGEKPAEPPAKAETSPSPEGGDIYGVAQRVRDARAKAGQVAPVATGEGVSPEDAVEWGRELLRSGLDADKMQDEIEKTGKISFDAAAATRAHGEDLAQAARNIEGKFGTESPEYKIAQKALNDWDARTKGQGTIWHKIGMSMQGETDIDTGTFTGLQRSFKADGGNDFTPSQSVKAKKIAADNAKAAAEAEAAKKALYAKADEPPMSPKQKAIIEKAISFLDKAADDALSRIRARRAQSRAFSVGDPNDLDDYVIWGAAKIAKGTAEFGKWSAEMAIELGDYIKPYLKSIWDAADNIDKQLYKITDAQTAQAAKQAVRKSPAKPKSLDEIKKVLAGHVQGRNWSPEQVHALWQHVKTYLDKGMDDYGDIRNKVATDLGLPVSEVNRGLTQNKATKRLADDVWRKQHTERMMKQHAKRWLREQQFPALEKAARMVPRLFFGAKVFGHGTVALGTHAPMVAFQPNYWSSYFRDFGKMYHMVGSAAFHEMQMTDLMHRPNYTVARRAGLVNDPLSYEDFNSPDMNAFANEIFGQDKAPELVKKGESAVRKIAGAGNRGYSVLKLLRQDMFDQRWEALPETAKTPEVAQAIADGINHATGVTKKSGLPGLNTVFFAPRLEASRIAWLTVDPGKAGKTFATWSHATDAEKQFAINQVKEKATVIATMGTLLALNQGILTASESKQKINFTDPMQSDWLKFKALGMDMSYGNPFITMVRLPVRLNSIRASDGGKLRNVIYPDESMSNEVFKYVRTQLSPFSSFLADIAFKGDYAERPLPEMPLSGSAIPLKKRLRAEGVKPYTWQEFLTETALPIPAEEAAREVFKGFQMDEDHQKTYLKSLFTIGLMTGTGGRVSEDWTLNQ